MIAAGRLILYLPHFHGDMLLVNFKLIYVFFRSFRSFFFLCYVVVVDDDFFFRTSGVANFPHFIRIHGGECLSNKVHCC